MSFYRIERSEMSMAVDRITLGDVMSEKPEAVALSATTQGGRFCSSLAIAYVV